jgi:Flp pilus assembly protein CpaB
VKRAHPAFLAIAAILIACFCGAAGFLVGRLFANSQTVQPPALETVPVLVAKDDLARGTFFSRPEEMVVQKSYLPESVPPGALQDPERLRYQSLTRRMIRKGEPVTLDAFQRGATQKDIISQLPPGTRGVTCSLNAFALLDSGFLVPGVRVDIIGTSWEGDNANKLVTKVVLENVLVLAITEWDTWSSIRPITLAVNMEDLERFERAKATMQLAIVLRRPGE